MCHSVRFGSIRFRVWFDLVRLAWRAASRSVRRRKGYQHTGPGQTAIRNRTSESRFGLFWPTGVRNVSMLNNRHRHCHYLNILAARRLASAITREHKSANTTQSTIAFNRTRKHADTQSRLEANTQTREHIANHVHQPGPPGTCENKPNTAFNEHANTERSYEHCVHTNTGVHTNTTLTRTLRSCEHNVHANTAFTRTRQVPPNRRKEFCVQPNTAPRSTKHRVAFNEHKLP